MLWAFDGDVPPPPPPAATALGQLSQNSAESTLRLGNLHELRSFLKGLPVLLRVRRVAIRDFEFWLKDLFLAADAARSTDDRAVRINLMDFGSFGAEPITIWRFLFSFFIKQAVPIVLSNSSALASAAFQISSASSSRLPHYLHYWDYLGRWETDDDEEEVDTRQRRR